MDPHPSPEELQAAAGGAPEARARLAPHLAGCPPCRERLAGLLGTLVAAAAELGPGRLACPPPELLAEMAPGAEADHPHVRGCPLCRQDLALIRALEAHNALGEAWSDGAPLRSERLTRRAPAYLQAAPGETLELELGPGATASGSVAGAPVRLEVAGSQLIVEVSGRPQVPLLMVLECDALVGHLPLAPGRLERPVGPWQRARVEAAG